MDQVFVLPTESVAALVGDQRSFAAGLISADTVVDAAIALWQINKINGLVWNTITALVTSTPKIRPIWVTVEIRALRSTYFHTIRPGGRPMARW